MSSETPAELRARVGHASQTLQAAVDDFDAAAAVRLGVNRTDLRCLEILLTEGPASPSRLGARLGLTTGSVTAMLDRLERLGHLTRSPDPDDRRKSVVQITEAATERAFALYGPLLGEADAVLNGYSAAELRLITGFLEASRDLYARHLARLRDTGG